MLVWVSGEELAVDRRVLFEWRVLRKKLRCCEVRKRVEAARGAEVPRSANLT